MSTTVGVGHINYIIAKAMTTLYGTKLMADYSGTVTYSSSLSLPNTEATGTFGFFATLLNELLDVPPLEENPNFKAFR